MDTYRRPESISSPGIRQNNPAFPGYGAKNHCDVSLNAGYMQRMATALSSMARTGEN
jgi:hypothetical protein